VVKVNFEELFGLLGLAVGQELHLTRKGLADVRHEGLSAELATQDLAGRTTHGLVDKLRGINDGAVEVEEDGLQPITTLHFKILLDSDYKDTLHVVSIT
jgi:hypothetical protein